MTVQLSWELNHASWNVLLHACNLGWTVDPEIVAVSSLLLLDVARSLLPLLSVHLATHQTLANTKDELYSDGAARRDSCWNS